MQKPWTLDGWLSHPHSMRWQMLYDYLKTTGETLNSKDLALYDIALADFIDGYGGCVTVCEHDEMHMPGLPCDSCWKKACDKGPF